MALELIGGALLSASLQFLLDRIGSTEVLAYLRGKPNESCDWEKLVRKLANDLTLVMAVIEDAENKQRKSKSVELWLDNLQDAVFDAEDLLDEIEYEAMRQTMNMESSVGSSKKRHRWKKKLHNKWDKIWRRPEEIDEMESKVKKVLEKFKDIASQKDLLGLEKGVVTEKASWRLSSCLVDESQVFGRDSEKREVIDSLLSDDISHGKLCTVSIVGMGGLGKTTLAQLVFNESKVKEHFEVKAWVCVSEEFDVCKATKAILEGVTSRTCDVTGLNEIQVQLKDRLMGKKFLIVLDDVWCDEAPDLDALCLPFKHGAQGSKILVTTRNENVSRNMRAARAHNLQTLSDEACWKLFASEASGANGDFTGNADLEMIGRGIVKKCQGLPIALKTLGGLLRSSLNVSEWKRILESDIWDLTEKGSKILPALKLSYHYLPSQLKRCFAYCSIFPSDYEFEKEDLVLLWMAENFLDCPNQRRRMEDVGDEYFNVLVSRSFFQRSKVDNSKFVMHDLVHDLAKFVSKGYCLLIEEDKEPSRVKVEKVRHVGYMATDINHYRRFNNILQSLNLRTFLSHGRIFHQISIRAVDELLLKLRCLRVLSLYGSRNVNLLPESIGELSHLRSLDLSYTNISSLPESVCKLLNLLTLKLIGCASLTKLPKDMHHLIKLRYLDLQYCSSLVEMPTQISKLKNLQILSTFIVGIDSGTKIGELRELSHLRGEISIKKLENVGNVKDSSDQARMMDKEHLESLRLYWSDDSNDDSQHAKDVLEMLMPNKALKELYVMGYTGKDFPNWIASEPLRNIVSILLSGCRNCLSLPPLGQLSTLKKLYISRFDALVSVGSEFYGDGCGVTPFPSLESLKFSDMESWESWLDDNSGGFSMLMELEVRNCKKLTGDLPSFLPSLTNFTISDCEGLDSQIPVGCLPILRTLSVHGCSKFEFKFDSPHMSLEQLSITRCCSALRSFQLDFFPMLKEANIAELKSLESLSISHGHLSSLNKLTISSCPELVLQQMHNLLLTSINLSGLSSPMSIEVGCLPSTLKELRVHGCSEFEFQFDSPHMSLENLWLKNCCSDLRSFPLDFFPVLKEVRVQEMKSLESLSMFDELCVSSLCIERCPSFKSLAEKMHNLLTSLNNLTISECPELVLFTQDGLPNSLTELKVSRCSKLVASRKNWELKRLPNLREFEIEGSDDDVMESFSEEGLLPALITRLKISRFPCLKSLDKNGLQQLTSLVKLEIHALPKLQEIPGEALPNSLQHLTIGCCDELQSISEEGFPTSLERLDIRKCPKCQIKGLPASLKELTIWGFAELQTMPEQVLRIPLRKLEIEDCPKLNINEFPSSLQQLVIRDCPLVARKCKEEYENNIINIPNIQIDWVRLMDLDSI